MPYLHKESHKELSQRKDGPEVVMVDNHSQKLDLCREKEIYLIPQARYDRSAEFHQSKQDSFHRGHRISTEEEGTEWARKTLIRKA